MNNRYWDDLLTYSLLCFGCYALSLPPIHASAQEFMAGWQWMNPKEFAEIVCVGAAVAIGYFLHRLVFPRRGR